MKHHRLISRKPEVAQISNYQAWKDFLVRLAEQMVMFVFEKTN